MCAFDSTRRSESNPPSPQMRAAPHPRPKCEQPLTSLTLAPCPSPSTSHPPPPPRPKLTLTPRHPRLRAMRIYPPAHAPSTHMHTGCLDTHAHAHSRRTPSTPTQDTLSPPPPSPQTRVGGDFLAHANIFTRFVLACTAVNGPQVCNIATNNNISPFADGFCPRHRYCDLHV
jgi:hypothetical protein